VEEKLQKKYFRDVGGTAISSTMTKKGAAGGLEIL
jgi:hypothetical protein